jgi:hypothetical protein
MIVSRSQYLRYMHTSRSNCCWCCTTAAATAAAAVLLLLVLLPLNRQCTCLSVHQSSYSCQASALDAAKDTPPPYKPTCQPWQANAAREHLLCRSYGISNVFQKQICRKKDHWQATACCQLRKALHVGSRHVISAIHTPLPTLPGPLPFLPSTTALPLPQVVGALRLS